MCCQKEYGQIIDSETRNTYWYVLITADLYSITQDKREKFNNKLIDEGWGKIENLSTSWQIMFPTTYKRSMIIEELKSDIKNAKAYAEVTKVNYAIQIGTKETIINNDHEKGMRGE